MSDIRYLFKQFSRKKSNDLEFINEGVTDLLSGYRTLSAAKFAKKRELASLNSGMTIVEKGLNHF